ncbi:MAG: creatininase family protein [Pseudomonadota bacterium]
MHISQMNWSQVEEYLEGDDRAVLPIGSTEQHAGLSLSVDSILSERVAVEAAEPLGVPVFPVVSYGLTPYFMAYPGTVTLKRDTYDRLIRDILESLAASGFRRVLIVNGHGGNQPARATAKKWVADHPEIQIRFHNWWNAPQTKAKVLAIDPVATHASWMENFPWTRLDGIENPAEAKPPVDISDQDERNPQVLRQKLGDGNFGGFYQRSDDDMLAIWAVAVEETRALIDSPWS